MEKIKALENLGLSEKEAKVYLALLELGQASAYRVAQKSGVKKPTTYVLLDELRKKELVVKMPGSTAQMFIAKSPEEFFNTKKYQILSATETLPEILSIMKKQNKVQTLYFEGVEGVRQALYYKMKENENNEVVGFYALAENIDKDIYDITWEWASDAKKYNISVRGFVPIHDTLTDYRKADAKYNRQMRELPYENYSSETSMDVMDNFVRIIDLTKNSPQAVIIENERTAKMFKQIFEMMWKLTDKN